MTARRIDGKAAAQAIRESIAKLVPAFVGKTGRPPGLATVLVGEDPASAVYVRSKNRATAETGMISFAHNLPDTTSEDDLLQLVIELNADTARTYFKPRGSSGVTDPLDQVWSLGWKAAFTAVRLDENRILRYESAAQVS